jgi:hypothetical protein
MSGRFYASPTSRPTTKARCGQSLYPLKLARHMSGDASTMATKWQRNAQTPCSERTFLNNLTLETGGKPPNSRSICLARTPKTATIPLQNRRSGVRVPPLVPREPLEIKGSFHLPLVCYPARLLSSNLHPIPGSGPPERVVIDLKLCSFLT